MVQPNVRPTQASPRSTLLVLVLTLALLLSGVMPVLGLPVTQAADPAPMPLMLGEYAQTDLAADESVAYAVVLPEDGDYLITAVDEEAAGVFDLLITDAEGNIVSDDLFGTTELTLTAGEYTLTFTAAEDGFLFFVVLGNFGDLRQSSEDPGKLVPGGIVATRARSTGDYYATLSVPPLEIAQEVLLYATPADPTQYLFVTVEGPNLYDYIDASETQLLRFWTTGGEYLVTVSPASRNQEFTLIPFLSGPPVTIGVGESLDGELDETNDETIYLISLDTIYTELIITLEGENDAADLDLLFTDALVDSNIYESSADTGSQEEITIETVLPGNYYIKINRYGSEGSAFILSVEGVEGEPFGVLEDGIAVDGALLDEEVESEVVYFEFTVETPGDLFEINLLSDEADAYFDVSVGRRPGDSTWYTYGYDGTASVSLLATQPGSYYVKVERYGTPAEFSIIMENLGPAPALVPGEYVRGELFYGETDTYQLEISEPGQILSLILVSVADNDLDLRLVLYNKFGTSTVYQSSSGAGGIESVTQALATPGLYEVQIQAYGDDSYYLFTELVNPYNLINATLDIHNLTGADVCSVVALPQDTDEEIVLVDEDTPLVDGDFITVTLATGIYSLQALDCDGGVVEAEIDVSLQGEMFWDLLGE